VGSAVVYAPPLFGWRSGMAQIGFARLETCHIYLAVRGGPVAVSSRTSHGNREGVSVRFVCVARAAYLLDVASATWTSTTFTALADT